MGTFGAERARCRYSDTGGPQSHCSFRSGGARRLFSKQTLCTPAYTTQDENAARRRPQSLDRDPAKGFGPAEGGFRSSTSGSLSHLRLRRRRPRSTAEGDALPSTRVRALPRYFRNRRTVILARHSVAHKERPAYSSSTIPGEHPQEDTVYCNARGDRMAKTIDRPTAGPPGARGETLA